jgi:hypothetical protein
MRGVYFNFLGDFVTPFGWFVDIRGWGGVAPRPRRALPKSYGVCR